MACFSSQIKIESFLLLVLKNRRAGDLWIAGSTVDKSEREAAIARAADGYRRAGLEPPIWEPDQFPVSLSMRLKFGWRIEDREDGTRVLIKEETP